MPSQLICRVRPCDKPSPHVSVNVAAARVEVVPEKGHPGEPLRFDRVLESDDQEALFELLSPSVHGCLQGHSTTIVAYGGPQSGKSYALSGFFMHSPLHGLAPRAIQLVLETLERTSSVAPIIETCFFDIQQDVVCDLLPRNCPRISMKESPQPPYVILDPNLTRHRCDGSDGYGGLLDTFFTGIEHRRKGAHTCFQISFLHQGGQQLSHLRFIEMAWPRSQIGTQSGGFTSAVPTPTKSSSPPAPAQGRAAAVLEQVIQSKLLGSPCSLYRSSPLVTLLKPCIERASALQFIYCLRLEQSQMPYLMLAVPLLTKLHLWMGKAGPPVVPDGRPAAKHTPPTVPPLRLGNSSTPVVSVRPPSEDLSMSFEDSMCTTATSVTSDSNGSPRQTGGSLSCPAPIYVPPFVPPVALPIQPPAAATTALPPAQPSANQVMVSGEEQVSAQDLRTLQECGELLEVKQRSVEMLRTDAVRSVAVLDDLGHVLDQLRGARESTRNEGPNEKETNLRMLYENVSRSLQRTTDELERIHDDINVLAQFCRGGVIPPIYDAYNATQEDVQKLLQHSASQSGLMTGTTEEPCTTPSLVGATAPSSHSNQASPQAAVTRLDSRASAASGASGNTEASRVRAPSAHGGEVLIPQLPLGRLSQHPQVPVQVAGPPPSTAATYVAHHSGRALSSSSASSSLSGLANVARDCGSIQAPATPPLAVAHNCSPVPFPARSLSHNASASTLSQTPPVPLQALPTHSSSFTPSSSSASGQKLAGWQFGTQVAVVRNGTSVAPAHCLVRGPARNSPEADDADESQTNGTPARPEIQRACSAFRLASMQMLRPSGEQAAGHDRSEGSRVRKSHSTTSLRSVGLRSAAAPPASAPSQGDATNPVPGVSPIRSTVNNVNASSATVPSHGPSHGACSPQYPPKRAILTATRHAQARPPGTRNTTPAPRVVAPVLAEERRVRSAAQCGVSHSPSPMMLGRNVSTENLRDRPPSSKAPPSKASA